MWNGSTCNWECNKVYKTSGHLDTKNCSQKKHLIGKQCQNVKMRYQKQLKYITKLHVQKVTDLIHTVSLAIICLLLLDVICVSCYLYYSKY